MGKSDGRTYDEVNADYKDVCAKFGNLDKVAFSSRIMKCLKLVTVPGKNDEVDCLQCFRLQISHSI